MAEYTVQAVITTSVEYHPRMLQNFNSTPENDREAGFISVGLLIGVILLGVSMFLCNVLVSKFWYVFIVIVPSSKLKFL
jgi:hypothetical protein